MKYRLYIPYIVAGVAGLILGAVPVVWHYNKMLSATYSMMIIGQLTMAEEIYKGRSEKVFSEIEDGMIQQIMFVDEVLVGDDRIFALKAIGRYVKNHDVIIGPDQKRLIESVQ